VNNRQAAYLGPPGTFSHEAALKFWQSGFELISCSTAQEVIRVYQEKEADQAILAIDTSLAGTVRENLDGIAKLDAVRIIGETLIAVHHQLIAKAETRIEEVKTILAHPKAMEECEAWLAENLPGVLRIPISSSAAAARKASADPTGETAAIASKTAADLYGMKILASDIETSSRNTTRFWIFGRETPPATGRDKTTLLVTEDLNGILTKLAKEKVRVLSIYERPSGGKIASPIYFLDIEGHIQGPPLSRLLLHFPEGRWLGSYPREY